MHKAPFLRWICLVCLTMTFAQKQEKTILDLARAFATDTSELHTVVAAGKIAITHSAAAIRSGANHRTAGSRPLAPVIAEAEERYQHTIVDDVGTAASALIEAVTPFDTGVAAAASRAAAASIPDAADIIQRWAQPTLERYDVATSSSGSLVFTVFRRAVAGSVIAVALAVGVVAVALLGESRAG